MGATSVRIIKIAAEELASRWVTYQSILFLDGVLCHLTSDVLGA